MTYKLHGLLLLIPFILVAQLEPTALLRGKVLEHGQPVRAELLFRDEDGKTIRAKSASDGSYQTVLTPGKTYTVTITNENLERYTFSYTIPPMAKYTELTQDFSLGQKIADATEHASPPQDAKKSPKSKKSKRKR